MRIVNTKTDKSLNCNEEKVTIIQYSNKKYFNEVLNDFKIFNKNIVIYDEEGNKNEASFIDFDDLDTSVNKIINKTLTEIVEKNSEYFKSIYNLESKLNDVSIDEALSNINDMLGQGIEKEVFYKKLFSIDFIKNFVQIKTDNDIVNKLLILNDILLNNDELHVVYFSSIDEKIMFWINNINFSNLKVIVKSNLNDENIYRLINKYGLYWCNWNNKLKYYEIEDINLVNYSLSSIVSENFHFQNREIQNIYNHFMKFESDFYFFKP